MKTPKITKTSVVLLVLFVVLGNSNAVNAQEKTNISLEKALDIARENYPSLKAASLEIKKQEALKSTAFDFGNTSVFTGQEEVGNNATGIRNDIGIGQSDINIFGIPAKSKLNKAEIQRAETSMQVTENALVRDVSLAWYRALSAKKHWQLYQRLDSVFADFVKAAELRFNTEQTSKVEYLAASARYQKLQVNLTKSKSSYRSSLQSLNQYLMLPGEFDIDENSIDILHNISRINMADSLGFVSLIKFYQKQVDVSKANWDVERSNWWPKMDIGYTRQSVDGQSGFYSWEAGISVPLPFLSQSGKTKAAQFDYEIAGQEYRQKVLKLKSMFKKLLSSYNTQTEILEYYRNQALPLADEQMESARLGYRLGSLDYIQFIQNVESAMRTKEEYISALTTYFTLKEQLEYISGK